MVSFRLKCGLSYMDMPIGFWKKKLWSYQANIKLFGNNDKKYD